MTTLVNPSEATMRTMLSLVAVATGCSTTAVHPTPELGNPAALARLEAHFLRPIHEFSSIKLTDDGTFTYRPLQPDATPIGLEDSREVWIALARKFLREQFDLFDDRVSLELERFEAPALSSARVVYLRQAYDGIWTDGHAMVAFNSHGLHVANGRLFRLRQLPGTMQVVIRREDAVRKFLDAMGPPYRSEADRHLLEQTACLVFTEPLNADAGGEPLWIFSPAWQIDPDSAMLVDAYSGSVWGRI